MSSAVDEGHYGPAEPRRTVKDRLDPYVPGLKGEMIAEFLGTFILILFGCGVVAQVVAGNGALGANSSALGGHDAIAWAWGLGVTMGAYVAVRISGAHLNPAVTIALACFGGFSWKKVAPYAVAQVLGAFVAALLVRWNYSEVISKIDPSHTIKTQGIFSTNPGNGALPVHEWGAFRDQIIGTAILVFVIFAIVEARNLGPLSNLGPFIIGLLVVAIGMAWGTDAGYAINPARDFGPRVAAFVTGYGSTMRDQYGNLYFWVPIVAPILGAVVGGALWHYLMRPFLPTDEQIESGA